MCTHKLRSLDQFQIPTANKTFFTRTVHFLNPRICNKLPNIVKKLQNVKGDINGGTSHQVNYLEALYFV